LSPDFFETRLNQAVLNNCLPYLRETRLKDSLNVYQYAACKTYLCNDLIYKNERMAAANGIVNRTPFIDYRLAELAFKIPAKFKLPGFTSKNVEKKYIYRQALSGLIPDEILQHRKSRGFSQPTPVWLKNELKEFVVETLTGKKARERGILDMTYVSGILDQHFNE